MALTLARHRITSSETDAAAIKSAALKVIAAACLFALTILRSWMPLKHSCGRGLRASVRPDSQSRCARKSEMGAIVDKSWPTAYPQRHVDYRMLWLLPSTPGTEGGYN